MINDTQIPRSMSEIMKEIETLEWDLPKISNNKVKAIKLDLLEKLKQELKNSPVDNGTIELI